MLDYTWCNNKVSLVSSYVHVNFELASRKGGTLHVGALVVVHYNAQLI